MLDLVKRLLQNRTNSRTSTPGETRKENDSRNEFITLNIVIQNLIKIQTLPYPYLINLDYYESL